MSRKTEIGLGCDWWCQPHKLESNSEDDGTVGGNIHAQSFDMVQEPLPLEA